MRGLIAALLAFAAAPVAAQEVDVNLTTQADGTRTLVHEITIPARITEVWRAIATVEGWRTWAVPLARRVPGSADRFETSYDPGAAPGAANTIEQQWVILEPLHRVVFRTTRTPAGFPHAEAYLRVTTTFELAPIGASSTRVRLSGAGYPPGPEGDTLISFFREGNSTSLRQLHARFATDPTDGLGRLADPDGE